MKEGGGGGGGKWCVIGKINSQRILDGKINYRDEFEGHV
jgi:hypothetical protein